MFLAGHGGQRGHKTAEGRGEAHHHRHTHNPGSVMSPHPQSDVLLGADNDDDDDNGGGGGGGDHNR